MSRQVYKLPKFIFIVETYQKLYLRSFKHEDCGKNGKFKINKL